MKLAAIDFEYNRPSNPGMGLISCVINTEIGQKSFWLRNPSEIKALRNYLLQMKDTHIFVGYVIQLAEARCFAAMGLDPCEFYWRDLSAEWKWLRNWDDRFTYGNVLTKDLQARYTVPPIARTYKKASQEEIDAADAENAAWTQQVQSESESDVEVTMDAAQGSLLDCLYFFEIIRFFEVRAAAEEKNRVREGIIMSCADAEIEAHREEILQYNASDVKCLHTLAARITEKMAEVGAESHCYVAGEIKIEPLDANDIEMIQLKMGDWCARSAKIAYEGVPINKERLEHLLKITPELTKEIINAWNKDYPLSPLYRVGLPTSILEKKKSCLKQSPYIAGDQTFDRALLMQIVAEYCASNGIDNWPMTKTGLYDTSQKVIARNSIGENIWKQFERHKQLLSTLKAFSEVKGKVAALEYIGTDYRQRPDYGAFGAQTARQAHKTKSLIPANAHVFRFLIEPAEGRAIVALDYSSEEVFIAAVVGNDDVMRNAYKAEDFYVAYARHIGMFPADLPIPTEQQRAEEWFAPYKTVRAVCKTLCLSISYGAGGKSISAAVRDATKDDTYDDAWGYEKRDEYAATFANYSQRMSEIQEYYSEYKFSQILTNGWRLGPNNPSRLSAANFHVQGRGACILQEACKRIHDAGLRIIFTMHDEIAVECNDKDVENVIAIMRTAMLDAAEFVLGETGMKVGAPEIIRHGDWWNKHSNKAEKGWKLFEKYFPCAK